MATIDVNIYTFNGFIRLQMDSLKSMGETSSDIIINPFKRYFLAPDKEFNMYIRQNKNDYEQGQDISEYWIMVMS